MKEMISAIMIFTFAGTQFSSTAAVEETCNACPYPASPVIEDISWHFETLWQSAKGTHAWAITWGPSTTDSPHGDVYAAWSDGGGFDKEFFINHLSPKHVDVGIARITGGPENLIEFGMERNIFNVLGGSNAENQNNDLWAEPNSGEITGLLYIDKNDQSLGTLYAWVNMENSQGSQFLPNQDITLAWSEDLGVTWDFASQLPSGSWRFADGPDGTFKPSNFLEFDQGISHPDGMIYFYGIRKNVEGKIFMGRVSNLLIQSGPLVSHSGYQYFSGVNADGDPEWTSKPTEMQEIFFDPQGTVNGGVSNVTYNKGLGRYIMIVHRTTGGKVGVFDGPNPWGPWTTVAYYDDWLGVNFGGTLGLNYTFSNKWTSADGLTSWLIFSVDSNGAPPIYSGQFNLIKATFKPRIPIVDTTPPTLQAVSAQLDELTVEFNEPVEQSSAEDLNHYSIDHGVSLISATLRNDLRTVTLKTKSPLADNNYQLTVAGVKDLAAIPNVTTTASQLEFAVDNLKVSVSANTELGNAPLTVHFTPLISGGSSEIRSFREVNGTVIMEGEHFTSVENIGPSQSVTRTHFAGYSGSGFVMMPQSPMGVFNYRMTIRNPGEYTLWIRRYSNGAFDNSVKILWDGEFVDARFDNGGDQLDWVWKQGGVMIDATVGEHTLGILYREINYRIDRILLTSNGDAPVGIGSLESSPTGGITYTWDFGDGNVSDEENPAHIYEQAGDYQVNLTVETEIERIDPVSLMIKVLNRTPVADAGQKQTIRLDYDHTQTTVSLDGSNSTDAEGSIVAYRWSGAPDPADVVSPQITLGVGIHTFALEVEDNHGATATDTVTIEVKPRAFRIGQGLVSLYTFGEGTGNTIQDVSGVPPSLNLTIDQPPNVSWLTEGGLSIDTSTFIRSPDIPTKLLTRLQTTNAITVEAWIKPRNTSQGQDETAPIITFSQNPSSRNFTLGQSGDRYEMNLRSSALSENGKELLTSPPASLTNTIQHVVYTRNADGARSLYLGGQQVISGNVLGDFSNWYVDDPRFGLANERTHIHPWLGEFHLVAVYDHALSTDEVQTNFDAGADGRTNFAPVANAGSDQIVPAGTPFRLDGSGSSHVDGMIVSYVWTGNPDPEDESAPQLNLSEGSYTFSLTVEDEDGSTDSDEVEITVINPDPGSIQFSAADYFFNENDGTATITITRTDGISGRVEVHYATEEGSAAKDEDYTETSGFVVFANGDSSDKTFSIPITDDPERPVIEDNETVNLSLSLNSEESSGVVLGTPSSATLTILDDDQDTGKNLVLITFENPNPTTSILYGQKAPLRAFVQIQGGSPLSTVAQITLRQLGTNKEYGPLSIISEEGILLLQGENSLAPDSVGQWEFEIVVPENDDFFEATATQTFEIVQSRSNLRLFNLGAPHFFRNPLGILGQLTLFNNNPGNLSLAGHEITFTITSPEGVIIQTTQPIVATTDENGEIRFDIQIEDFPKVFDSEGNWFIQAHFAGSANIASTNSAIVEIPIRRKQGYAILVHGSVPNREGFFEHQRTIHYVERVLHADGKGLFNDDINDDIKIINSSLPETNPKSNLEDTIKNWASEKLNESPAPLYLILLNHGDIGNFHLDNATLTPDELDLWLTHLQDSLSGNALAQRENIIIILGMCYSGSFIEQLSAENRIIISASKSNERSIRGPGEPSKRQGEYFVHLLFRELDQGTNLLDSFKRSRDLIHNVSAKFNLSTDANGTLSSEDLGQHPLLEDNQDGQGSDQFSSSPEAGEEGNKAKKIVLKIPDNSSDRTPIQIARTSPSVFLNHNDPPPISVIWAEVDEAVKDQSVSTIFMEVRKPGAMALGGSLSMQASLEFTRQEMELDTSINDRVRFRWPGPNADEDLFNAPGEYEIFFFAQRDVNLPLSEAAATFVFRATPGGNAPAAFDLISPRVDPSTGKPPQIDFVTPGKLGYFLWEGHIADQSIQYFLRIWSDQQKSSLVFESPPRRKWFFQIQSDQVPLGPHWWDVVAVSKTGNSTASSHLFPVTFIPNSDNPSATIAGLVFDKFTNLPLPATIKVDKFLDNPLQDIGIFSFSLAAPLDTKIALTVSSVGYRPFTVSDLILRANDLVEIEFPMEPEEQIGIQIEAGWNLISPPRDRISLSLLADLSTGRPLAWEDGRFRVLRTLSPGFACWVHSEVNKFIPTNGPVPNLMQVDYPQGWNLVGPIGDLPLERTQLTQILGRIWGWDRETQSYFSIENTDLPVDERNRLLPGQGYWIYINSPQTLNMGQ